ncbi:MAG: hypothetical protein ACYS76_04380 [Planctomycetota bacterium]|jgi:hypothetical protein
MSEQEHRDLLRDKVIKMGVENLIGRSGPAKKLCLKQLADFREMRNSFRHALQRAQKKAKDNPDLRCYDEDAEPPIEGYELEKANPLRLWEGGFWRRPDKGDKAIEKDWKTAQGNTRLRKYEMGPPEAGWVWQKRARRIGFWRSKLPFNPDAWLQTFRSKTMAFFYGLPPEEPPDSKARLLCDYALFAALYDYHEGLGTPPCDRLTDNEKDDWAEQLCDDVLAVLGADDWETLGDRATQIEFALERVKADLEEHGRRPQPNGKGTIKERFSFAPGQVFYNGQDLQLPAGDVCDAMKKLVDKLELVVPYKDLDATSVNQASDRLRGIIKKINDQLKAHEVRCSVVAKRTEGYSLIVTKDSR